MELVRPNIAIMIMAAGASSRMGTTKQLLPWGKSTLIENAIKNAEDSDASDVFVVLGAMAGEIKESMECKDESIIYNPDWESGLGSSIAFATRSILAKSENYDGILVMLTDQPLVDSTYLNQLIAAFHGSDQSIIATKYNHGNGVPAIFGSAHFLELQQLNTDSGARDIIRRHKHNLKSIDPMGKTADVDTYEEYLSLVQFSIK